LQDAAAAAAEMAAGRVDAGVAGVGDDLGVGVPTVASWLQRAGSC
jgi:hypothetical protein